MSLACQELSNIVKALFILPRLLLPKIWSQLLWVLAMSGLSVVLWDMVPVFRDEESLGNLDMLTIIISPVAFLLAFRADMSMRLFWDSHTELAMLRLAATTLGRQTVSYIPEAEVEVVGRAEVHRISAGRLVPDPGEANGPPILPLGAFLAGRKLEIGGEEVLQLPLLPPPFTGHFRLADPQTAILKWDGEGLLDSTEL
eukprot:Hpha_TRINITY_DN1141_c0_g1::TRINITY_DN1141_c0_g1_i1::g.113091::m.113091